MLAGDGEGAATCEPEVVLVADWLAGVGDGLLVAVGAGLLDAGGTPVERGTPETDSADRGDDVGEVMGPETFPWLGGADTEAVGLADADTVATLLS